MCTFSSLYVLSGWERLSTARLLEIVITRPLTRARPRPQPNTQFEINVCLSGVSVCSLREPVDLSARGWFNPTCGPIRDRKVHNGRN